MGKTIDYRDAAYWKDIVKAKQAFLAGDQAAAEGRVRPLVLDSWKRCLPFLGTKLAKKRTCLEQSALTHVMQQNRELLACAIPVIEYLNTILGSSSTVVLLPSGDGVLLHKHVGTKSRAAAAVMDPASATSTTYLSCVSVMGHLSAGTSRRFSRAMHQSTIKR